MPTCRRSTPNRAALRRVRTGHRHRGLARQIRRRCVRGDREVGKPRGAEGARRLAAHGRLWRQDPRDAGQPRHPHSVAGLNPDSSPLPRGGGGACPGLGTGDPRRCEVVLRNRDVEVGARAIDIAGRLDFLPAVHPAGRWGRGEGILRVHRPLPLWSIAWRLTGANSGSWFRWISNGPSGSGLAVTRRPVQD